MSSLFGSQEILIILETLFLRTPNNHLYLVDSLKIMEAAQSLYLQNKGRSQQVRLMI